MPAKTGAWEEPVGAGQGGGSLVLSLRVISGAQVVFVLVGRMIPYLLPWLA